MSTEKSLLLAVTAKMKGAAKLWIDGVQVTFTTWQQFSSKFAKDLRYTFDETQVHFEMTKTIRPIANHRSTIIIKYVLSAEGRLQHEIDPKNAVLSKKFEKKVPICTSYILASLQYHTKIANYHLQAMEMCLALFNSASTKTMRIISQLDSELISFLWMPVEFAGDYNTQKMALRLIVNVLKHTSEPNRRIRLNVLETSQDIQNLLFKLVGETDACFERISRELLNKFNMEVTQNCAVFSVYCTVVHFGSFKLTQPENSDKFWIDFNYNPKSVSFLCNLNKNNRQQEELSITIKIDQLKIENKLDCIVVSVQPAEFSVAVSEGLKNARIAIFTLPPNEVNRLKANRNLLDFYNSSYKNSEIKCLLSGDTNEEYLVGDVAMNEPTFETQTLTQSSRPSQTDDTLQINSREKEIMLEPGPVTSHQNNNTQKFVISPIENRKNPQKIPNEKRKRSVVTNNKENRQAANNKITREVSATNSSTVTASQKRTNKTNKESNCNVEASTSNENESVFKRPRVSRVLKATRTSSSADKPSTQIEKPILKQSQNFAQKEVPVPVPSTQPITLPKKQSRRFFKQKSSSSAPKRAKKLQEKKTDKNASKFIPKLKEVNSLKPFNHLIKPNCDLEEAALELVENGGYENIVKFVQSKAGSTCFNDQQRKQILQNIERINEHIERSANRSPTNNHTDNDGDSIWKEPIPTKRKGNTLAKESLQVSSFVPYSKWKTRQKSQNTETTQKKATTKLKSKAQQSKFDQNIIADDCQNNANKSRQKLRIDIPYVTSANSGSSLLNHNFDITESDDDMVDATGNREPSISDLQCRQEIVPMCLSPVPVPVEQSEKGTRVISRKFSIESSRMSLDSTFTNSFKFPQCETEHNQVFTESCSTNQGSCQMSEIFEDAEPLPTAETERRPILVPSTSSRNSVVSNNVLEALSVSYSQISPQSVPIDVHTESDQNPDLENTWFIEKYLTDQRLYSSRDDTPSPSKSRVESNQISTVSTSTPRLPNITTNQVIIQNQFVLSTVDQNTEPSLMNLPTSVNEQIPLKPYIQLFPKYMERVVREKNSLLRQLEHNLELSFFERFNGLVDEVLKSISDHEAAIKETQEQLSSYFKKLDHLIQGQQKNRAQLEEIYRLLLDRLRTSIPDADEVEVAYEEATDKLQGYANKVRGELWQSFASRVVTSIENRLKKLVDF